MRRDAWVAVVLLMGCVHAPLRGLELEPEGWLPQNRTRLEALLDGPTKGVAAFDWDNTMMKNDIGDATMFWMLRNDRVLQPPGRDWAQTSKGLTAAARAALNAACDGAAEPGKPLATRRVTACADVIFGIYEEGMTPSGEAAWTAKITATSNAAYLWTAQLTAGHTPEQIRGFALAAFGENAGAAPGTQQTVGSHSDVPGWVRIYPQMKDLVQKLTQRGFDVWVVSASPQPFAEMVAMQVGIAADHVIGIRSVLDDVGRVTYRVQGCGPSADGDDTIMTFNEGKRCWINKVIFHAANDEQLTRLAPPRRTAFAAGDSDTDVAFVKDAGLKLVVNRNKPELMCNALANHAGTWMIQPMFLEPMPRRTTPYPCATATTAAGGPFLDEADQPIADLKE